MKSRPHLKNAQVGLEADPSATCVGIAFEFPEEKRREVLDYISQREGGGFDLTQQEIRLQSGDQVTAVVAIYSDGKSSEREVARRTCDDGPSS